MMHASIITESSEWIEKYQPLSVPPFAKWADQYQTIFLAFDSCFEATDLSDLCHQFVKANFENKSVALIIALSSSLTLQLDILSHPSLIQINYNPNHSSVFNLLASVHALILPKWSEIYRLETLASFLMNRPILLIQAPNTNLNLDEAVLIPTQTGFKGLLDSYISRRHILRPRQCLLANQKIKAAIISSQLLVDFPNTLDLETIEGYMNAGYFDEAGVLAFTLLRNLHWLKEDWDPEKGLIIMKACLFGCKYFEAIKIGRKLLSFMPENSTLALYLSNAFFGIKDFNNAKIFLERSLAAEEKSEIKNEVSLSNDLKVKINRSILKCIELPIIIFNPISRLSAANFIAQTLSQSLSLPIVHLSTGLDIGKSNTLHFERTAELIYNNQGALAFDRWPATEANRYFLLKFFKNMIIHVRDPRSILVSTGIYLNHILGLEKKRELPVQFQKSIKFLNWDPRLRSFAAIFPGPKQIEYGLETGLFQAYLSEILAWIELEKEIPSSFKILMTSYEQFINNKEFYFRKILDFHQINPDYFDYKKKSINSLTSVFGPTPNIDSSCYYFRRGDPHEWSQFASESQKKIMTNLIPNSLFERFEWNPTP